MSWIYTQRDQILRLEKINYFWIEEIPTCMRGTNTEFYGVFCKDNDCKEWCIAEFQMRSSAVCHLTDIFEKIKGSSCESQS